MPRHGAFSAVAAVMASLATVAPVAAQDAIEGARLYADFCAVCHGDDLRGDGPMAPILSVPPADLTALAAGGVFPVFDVARRIDGRDPLLAHGGEMPMFGQWFQGDGPDVGLPGPGGQPILMSRPIADLVAYLMEEQS